MRDKKKLEQALEDAKAYRKKRQDDLLELLDTIDVVMEASQRAGRLSAIKALSDCMKEEEV